MPKLIYSSLLSGLVTFADQRILSDATRNITRPEEHNVAVVRCLLQNEGRMLDAAKVLVEYAFSGELSAQPFKSLLVAAVALIRAQWAGYPAAQAMTELGACVRQIKASEPPIGSRNVVLSDV